MQASQADPLGASLKKVLKVALKASQSKAYVCETSGAHYDKCVAKNALERLTQNDLNVFRTNFLKSKLQSFEVERIIGEAYSKMTDGSSVQQIFEAQDVLQREFAQNAFEMCRNITRPNVLAILLDTSAPVSGILACWFDWLGWWIVAFYIVFQEKAEFAATIQKVDNLATLTNCLCLHYEGQSAASPGTNQDEVFTQTDLDTLKTQLEDQVIPYGISLIDEALKHLLVGTSAIEQYQGYVSSVTLIKRFKNEILFVIWFHMQGEVLNLIVVNGALRLEHLGPAFGDVLVRKIQQGEIEMNDVTALFAWNAKCVT